jgi:hypothetical protein
MNDRELLESAAKAVGIDYWSTTKSPDGLVLGVGRDGPVIWNPLTSDALAFRLAVELDISVRQQFAMVEADYPWTDEEFNERTTLCEAVLDDYCAATRRAIVRAAAAIGNRVDAPLVRADLER